MFQHFQDVKLRTHGVRAVYVIITLNNLACILDPRVFVCYEKHITWSAGTQCLANFICLLNICIVDLFNEVFLRIFTKQRQCVFFTIVVKVVIWNGGMNNDTASFPRSVIFLKRTKAVGFWDFLKKISFLVHNNSKWINWMMFHEGYRWNSPWHEN